MVKIFTKLVKTIFLRIFAGTIMAFLVLSCTIDDTDPDQLQNINSVFVGTKILDFRSAKLSITGPANITGVNSHVRAKLELSSAPIFQEPFADNSSIMVITLMSVNTGTELPKFPLANGFYDVFPPSGFQNPEIITTLNGVSFCFGPSLGIGYKPNLMTFDTTHESLSGTIQVTFDVKNSLVKITHDYLTAEGVKVSGSNTLPLNLGSFNP